MHRRESMLRVGAAAAHEQDLVGEIRARDVDDAAAKRADMARFVIPALVPLRRKCFFGGGIEGCEMLVRPAFWRAQCHGPTPSLKWVGRRAGTSLDPPIGCYTFCRLMARASPLTSESSYDRRLPTGGAVLFSQEIALFSKPIADFPVSSGVMSPWPLESSKDLTVPKCFMVNALPCRRSRNWPPRG